MAATAEINNNATTETTLVGTISTPAPPATTDSEDAKKRAHEESEAKRKAEWEQKKKEREEKILMDWEKAVDVTDDQLSEISVKRLGDMTERLTRRNMKLCVTEYVQTLCYENMELARNVMHPAKSMINCFKYINRKALEYLKQQQEDIGEKAIDGVIGGDVPDDLCYQWAQEYFMNLDVQEDKTDEDEEFVPKPYHSATTSRAKKKEVKKEETPKKDFPKKAEPVSSEMEGQVQLSFDGDPQMTLLGDAA